MKKIKGNITAPKGFFQAGIHCGIKKRNPDLALILSETLSTACGVFTSNSFKAAPVILTKEHLNNSRHKAVIINSGNANCLTGKAGVKDSEVICKKLGSLIGSKKEDILICSTGIIGKRLPAGKITSSLKRLVSMLHRSDSKKAAKAIMTTDTFLKEAAYKVNISGRDVVLAGIAKGAAMIQPDMATMLSVITTDAGIKKSLLARALKDAVKGSFNCVTVDGDMSTNDTVLILANGLSGVSISRQGSSYSKFVNALSALCLDLAKMVVSDGEGATKFIQIDVINARTGTLAKEVGLKLANSPLFKTMCYGNDPNFGRIAAACGAVKSAITPERVDIYINGKKAVNKGNALSAKFTPALLKGRNIKVLINLNSGNKSARIFTSDLTPEYIKINASYN